MGILSSNISSQLIQPGDSINNQLVNYLIDSHEDNILFCRKDNYAIIAANESSTHIFADDRHKIIGKNIFELLPFTTPASVIEQISKLEQDGLVDVNISTSDDNVYNLKVSLFYEKLLFVIKNLSKKSGNLEENSFKMLFENMSSGFIYMKAIANDEGEIVDHHILDVNSTFEILFNVERSEVLGKKLSEVVSFMDDILIKILAKTSRSGSSYSDNFFFKPLKKHFEVRTYSPRKGYSAAVFNDIKAEMEIRNDLIVKNEISKAFALGHNTDLYKVVLNLVLKATNSPYGYIGYLSNKGDIVCFACNDDKIQVVVDEHGNERIVDISSMISSHCIASKKQEIGSGLHKHILSTPVIDNDKVIGLIGTAGAVNNYNQKAKSFIQGLANYISPLMAAEIKDRNYRRDLVEAKERAEENEKLKSSFLANISHEIRTPMNGITGFCELLAKADNLTEKQQKYISIIIKSSRQLLHIVEDIMDMSKLQTQQAKLNVAPLHLNKMLDEIEIMMSAISNEKHIELVVNKGLADDAAYIYADSYKLKKILESLISNGIKFTNVGSVSFGYQLEDDSLVFKVADTGIGIRKELHEGIFSSFRQAENLMERKYSGVGIGLSISKGFVDLMNGKIWLESEPGNGSTFFVKIKYDPVN
ncbi:MAG: PAS domain-containing protein [Bacteroidales bacterium]|nr:PAS domain-containing protein [Bacteroidales bacterium]